MDQQVINIRQIANRLENATNSSERIDTLKNLKSLVRTNPLEVGKHSLPRLIELLKEQGSSEEYQEALELISRLVKTKDKIAAASSASFILTDIMNVELLLDLLEHEDGLVGVMTSEILTEIHAIAGDSLEIAIQECPAGMNKLLQRLPDKSREEVRNQAILLVQQLTAKNEEMKKTVAFNEGFDILFGIIKSEGGASDPSVVVQDCLRICANILSGSETCQRLFYGMDGGWHLRLLEFFDPEILENIDNNNSLQSFGLEDDNNDTNIPWFMQTNRLDCAVMAITALSDSQHTPIPKHQVVVGVSTQSIISCASFWIARQGPYEVLLPALQLLLNVVRDNSQVSSYVSSYTLKVTSAIKGKHIPSNIDISLSFGWRPLPADDRRFIAIPTLLADRYVFGVPCWSAYSDGTPAEQATLAAKIRQDVCDGSLRVLDILLAADSTTSGLVMQHILAPPPPSPEDELSGALETMKPFGVLILNTLVESCSKALAMQGAAGGGNSTHSTRGELDTACKCANLLTLVFIHGGLLARELSTALSTGHTSLGAGRGGPVSSALAHQPLLPFLLSTAGRSVRVQGGGYALVTALIRMLSVAGADCVRAVRQMLEDPSNLFVADLTSTSSEMSGVPHSVQIICCLFLGVCFHSLRGSSPTPSSEPTASRKDVSGSDASAAGLTQKSMLAMIDSRVGLSRFTEQLKKPLTSKPTELLAQELFFTASFRAFYESQEQIIRQSIFDYYSVGNGLNGSISSSTSQERQIIDMQKQQILELEEKLKKSSSGPPPPPDANLSSAHLSIIEEKEMEIETLKKQLEEKDNINISLTENISVLQKRVNEMKESNDADTDAMLTATEGLKAQLEASTAHSSQLEVAMKQLENTIAQNSRLYSEMQQKLAVELEEERARSTSLSIRCQQLEQEAVQTRQRVNDDSLQAANNMIAKNQELTQLRQQVASLQTAVAKEAETSERLRSQSSDSSSALTERISYLESQCQAALSSAERERTQSQQDATAYLSKISSLQTAFESSTSEFELYKSQSIVQINALQDQLAKLESVYSATVKDQDTLRIASSEIAAKLQAQIVTLESQLQESITEANKYKQQSHDLQSDAASKLSSLEVELNHKELDLKKEIMKSTALEQQVQNLLREHKLVLTQQSSVHTQQMLFRDSEQKKLNEEILKLKEAETSERLRAQSSDSSSALTERISYLESQCQAALSSAERERTQSQQDATAYLSKISSLQTAFESSTSEFELYKSQSIVQINALQDQLAKLESVYSATVKDQDTLRIASSEIAAKLQAQIDALESQLQESITEANKYKKQSQDLQSDSASKLSSLEVELNHKELDLKKEIMKSTALEQQVQNLLREHKLVLTQQSSVHTQQMLFRDSEQKKLNEEIFKLKEQYLSLCSEKGNVEEERNKLLRRIELLEEEIRAPVESTKDKDVAISDLRDRNAELLQKLWQVESDLKEALAAVDRSKTIQLAESSPPPPSPPPTFPATLESYLQYFQIIINSMTDFSDKLEIDMEEHLNELKLATAAQPITAAGFGRQCELISLCLNDAFETWSLASSSMTDEVGTIRKDSYKFTTAENTLPRLIECTDVFGEVLKEKDAQLETLTANLTAWKDKYDLKDIEYETYIKDYTKEVQVNIELKEEIAQLQSKLQAQLEVLSSSSPVSDKLNPKVNEVDNTELLRLQQLQLTLTQDKETMTHQLEVANEEKNNLTNLVTIKEEQLNQANIVTAKLSRDLEKLSLQLQPLQEEITQKEAEITSLKSQLQDLQDNSLQRLTTEIDQLEANFVVERNQFNEKINQLEIQTTTLTNSINAHKILSESTINELEQRFEVKVKELEAIISNLTTQLNEEKAGSVRSAAVLAKKEAEISDLKTVIESHKAPIVASNTVIFQQLEVTKRELAELKREKEALERKANAIKVPAAPKRSTSITGAISSSSSATSGNSTPSASDNTNEVQRLFKDFQKLELQLKKEREGAAKAEVILRNKTQEIEQLKSKVAMLESTATATAAAITTTGSKDEFSSSSLGNTINSGEGPGSRIWMQRQLDRLNKEVRNLREENDDLISKMEILKSAATTAASLQTSVPKPVNEEISELLETVEKLRLEKANVVTQLNVERGGAQRLKKELDEARAELELDASLRDGPIFVTSSGPGLSINLPESPAAIHHSINSANIVQERDSLFKANWRLREQLDAKNKEIEAVRTDVKVAEEIRHKASLLLLKEELAQSSTKILALESEIQELLKLRDKITSLENQHTSNLQTIESLNSTIQKKEKEWQVIDKQLTMSQKDCEKYYQQSERLKSEVDLHCKEVERLRVVIKEDEHRISDTAKDGDSKSRELLQLKLLHDTLKQELKLSQSRVATEEAEVERLKKIIFDKDTKLIEAVSLGETKSKEVLSLNSTIDTLKKEMLALQTHLATESAKILEMRESHTSMTSGLLVKIDSFQQQLKERTKQCTVLTATETELQARVDNLTREVTTLTKKLHEEEVAHSAALTTLTSQSTDQSRFSTMKVGQLEIELVHNKAEREELQLRFDALQRRYEAAAVQAQEREDEVRSLQATLRHDRMQAQSSIDMLNQAKLSSLVHISRTVLSEFDYLSQLQDQKLRTALSQLDHRVDKMKGCVYSTGQSFKQLRGFKAQVRLLQKMIKKQEEDSVASKHTVDSATRELRGLLIWLHSLRLTGPSDFISIIETDDRNYSSQAVAVKLPVYIKQARQQLESVFAAQSELIHQQRLKVREKEDAVKELEAKLKYSDKDTKRGHPSTLSPPSASVHFSTSLTPRTPHTIDSLTYSTQDSSSRYSNTNNHLLSGDNPLSYHSSSLSSRYPTTPSTPGYPTTPKVKDTTYGTYSSGGNGSISRRSVSAGRYGVTSSGNGYEPMEGGVGGGGGAVMSPMTNELTRLHAELRKEKEKLSTLQEQHSDLLALLAQQEIEFQTIQDALYAYAGSEAVERALAKAKQTVKAKFGSYIEFRKHSSSIKY